MSKWIKCSDMLPGNGSTDKEFMIYETLNNQVQHDYYIVPGDSKASFWNHYGKYVTHWQPLPEPPEKA